MKPKPHLDQSTQEEQIREALNTHWRASAVGDANAEHDIYDDEVICDYPQSGERILGRSNLQALRSHHPGKPSGFRFPKAKNGMVCAFLSIRFCNSTAIQFIAAQSREYLRQNAETFGANAYFSKHEPFSSRRSISQEQQQGEHP
jgi:hypothetical protein